MRLSQPRWIGASIDEEHEGAVAGEQVEQAEEQQHLREHRIEAVPQRHQPDQIEHPEDRVEQARQRGAADEEHEAEEAEQAGGADQVQRPARVHQQRLQIALDPARALLDPGRGLVARLLEGGGVDDADAVALLGQADAEIGVLGDVERIPGAKLAQHVDLEMVGGAAERDRNAEAFEAGQHLVEPQRIVEREHPRQPVVVGVEVVQPALQAGGVGGRAREGGDHLAELIGLGPVLGVVDHEIFAAGEAQRIVAGLRLGLGLRRRHADHLEHAFEAERARDLDGVVVVGLEHELDVELAERIVELAQRLRQHRQHRGASRYIGTSTVKTGSSSSVSSRAASAMAWSASTERPPPAETRMPLNRKLPR